MGKPKGQKVGFGQLSKGKNPKMDFGAPFGKVPPKTHTHTLTHSPPEWIGLKKKKAELFNFPLKYLDPQKTDSFFVALYRFFDPLAWAPF